MPLHDSSIELRRGLVLRFNTPTHGDVEIALDRTHAQVLAAGLRRQAGVVNRDDSHLAELADLVLGTERLPPSPSRRKTFKLQR